MSGSRGPRGPYAKTQARRAEILGRAHEAFGQRGFQGASLREIAEAVGLSQAGVLHHFSSKEALLAAVLEEKDAASVTHFEQAAGRDVLDALRQVVADNTQQRELVRLFATLSAEAISAEHPAHAWFQERYSTSRARLADALRAGQQSGQVTRALAPDRMAAAVLAVMDGLQVQWLLDPGFDMLAAFSAFVDTLRPPG